MIFKAPDVATTSITLGSNRIQNGEVLVLVPANPGPPGKEPLNGEKGVQHRNRRALQETEPSFCSTLLFNIFAPAFPDFWTDLLQRSHSLRRFVLSDFLSNRYL